MTVWTVAFGFLIGKIIYNMITSIVEGVDKMYTRYLDEKDPEWREKWHNKKHKPKEPIDFKQTTIES